MIDSCWKLLCQNTTDHHGYQLVLVDIGCVSRPDDLPIAQNGHSIRHGEQLSKPMGNEYDRISLLFKPVHDAEKNLRLLLGKR